MIAITQLLSLTLILSIGTLNALRGSGFADGTRLAVVFSHRYLWAALMALCIAIYIHSYVFFVPIFALIWFALAPGWGLYMNASYPNLKYVNETEVKTIDWIVNKIVGRPTTEKQFSLWCTLAMSLRGLLFYPVFVVLGLLYPATIIYGFGMALMGIIYWGVRIVPVGYHIRVAEFITGCLLGGLVVLST